MRRGNLLPTITKSLLRVSISLSSLTSITVMPRSLACTLRSVTCSNSSSAGAAGAGDHPALERARVFHAGVQPVRAGRAALQVGRLRHPVRQPGELGGEDDQLEGQ